MNILNAQKNVTPFGPRKRHGSAKTCSAPCLITADFVYWDGICNVPCRIWIVLEIIVDDRVLVPTFFSGMEFVRTLVPIHLLQSLKMTSNFVFLLVQRTNSYIIWQWMGFPHGPRHLWWSNKTHAQEIHIYPGMDPASQPVPPLSRIEHSRTIISAILRLMIQGFTLTWRGWWNNVWFPTNTRPSPIIRYFSYLPCQPTKCLYVNDTYASFCYRCLSVRSQSGCLFYNTISWIGMKLTELMTTALIYKKFGSGQSIVWLLILYIGIFFNA